MNLRDWRLRQRKTQDEVAIELDCEQGMVSKWERGVVQPTARWLARIEALTGNKVRARDFVKGGES